MAGAGVPVKNPFLLSALALCLLLCAAAADPALTITVETDRPGTRINPAMWGIFFEDINFGADGGLYAELVKNRGFEFPDPWMGWSKIVPAHGQGSVEMRDYDPFDAANPHYLRVTTGFFSKGLGVSNEGFRGIGVQDGAACNFSVEARALAGKPALRIELVSGDGHKLASAKLGRFSFRWKKYTAQLRAHATEPRAHLNLIVEGPGTLELDMVSLFPADTWKHRANGLRADLVRMLADLKPGFLRFPGGCIVEGRDLANRYEWKNTILDTADRPLKMNRWNVEFKDRPAPDYFESFGLGFFEYFQLCEDIGAEPLPVLNCGMACQFNSGELAPLYRLDPYIQDALDLIQFANGPANSEWGARRSAMGHPAPFHLKYLGVGNEQWGSPYVERFAMFAQALKRLHPEIQLVAASGPDPDGERFDFLWSRLRELRADFVDEHFYRPPEWFLNNAGRYDHYSRTGPKVLAGEYAARAPNRENNLQSALAEAAMMTGFERNADVVRMASYAPLFGRADAWQWRPSLIWFDNLRVFATPDYYAQQLFSRNRGDVVLPVRQDGPASGPGSHPTLFASATRDEKAGEIILKVVNVSTNPVEAGLRFDGVAQASANGTETVLTAASLNDENSLENPDRVAPRTRKATVTVPDSSHIFPAISLTVLRVRAKH
jgi:alpha-L-arabinofuranosidase